MNLIFLDNEFEFLNVVRHKKMVYRDITGSIIRVEESFPEVICGEVSVGSLCYNETVVTNSEGLTETISCVTETCTDSKVVRYADDLHDRQAFENLDIVTDELVGYCLVASVTNVVNCFNQLGEVSKDMCTTLYLI